MIGKAEAQRTKSECEFYDEYVDVVGDTGLFDESMSESSCAPVGASVVGLSIDDPRSGGDGLALVCEEEFVSGLLRRLAVRDDGRSSLDGGRLPSEVSDVGRQVYTLLCRTEPESEGLDVQMLSVLRRSEAEILAAAQELIELQLVYLIVDDRSWAISDV